MVKTTAAHFSLRQQKITLANRPSPGQPITTSNKNLVASYGYTLSSNKQATDLIRYSDFRSKSPVIIAILQRVNLSRLGSRFDENNKE